MKCGIRYQGYIIPEHWHYRECRIIYAKIAKPATAKPYNIPDSKARRQPKESINGQGQAWVRVMDFGIIYGQE